MMDTENTKYAMLLRILDALRDEARGTKWASLYGIDSYDLNVIQYSRTRAFIHLYLKVMFGIAEFSEREHFVTDGPNDGGIDGYYIDSETKKIFLLQSKFRNTERNFEKKEIEPKELLAMDIDRITQGNKDNSEGIMYNGKIQGLIRQISEISDIARYSYEVAIIANCSIAASNLRKLTDGLRASVFNFERAYNELVFPVVSGAFFRANDVTIQLDLNNKSAGAKTSYSVSTPEYLCEITVLFIPTLEIAKAMDRYRNTILEYNPRSYLDFREGKNVHASIRETLLRENSNEFALMNNGLTILSDETNLNERIGQHNKAQLRLLKPQIINGGQTAYTLSRVYSEDPENAESKLAGKEVLTKIITLTAKDSTKDTALERLRLIEEISAASNRQVPVVAADRGANDDVYIRLQKMLFHKYGILYERKRGEFSDGIKYNYIDESQLLERNLLIRIFLATKGMLLRSRHRRIFISHNLTDQELLDETSLDLFADGYGIFRKLVPGKINGNQPSYKRALAKVYLGVTCTDKGVGLDLRIETINKLWQSILDQVLRYRQFFVVKTFDLNRNEVTTVDQDRWIGSVQFESDIQSFARHGNIQAPTELSTSIMTS